MAISGGREQLNAVKEKDPSYVSLFGAISPGPLQRRYKVA